MNEDESPLEKERKEREIARASTALQFEHVVSHVWNDRPMQYEGWMNKIQRGGADGYAEADIWRSLNREGKVTDIDVAYVKALLSLSHQVAYLKSRIKELESKI